MNPINSKKRFGKFMVLKIAGWYPNIPVWILVLFDLMDVSVTVTMGVSPYRDGMTIQAMMNDADEKLYWGKRHGKNQVVSKLQEDHKAQKKHFVLRG